MIAITGASGLVGGNLVRALLAQGHPVRALVHRDRRALKGLNIDTVTADLTDLFSLRKAFDGAEIVYHLASSISIRMDNWDELERINVTGTQNVIKACLDCAVNKLVYFSTIHAYHQEPFDQVLDEDRPLQSGSNIPPYERSKALAELIVRQAAEQGLAAIIIIPTAIIGPYDFRPSYLGQALKLLATSRIPVLVRGGYNWVDVRDVVEGAMQAERIGKNGTRYIISGHWKSILEVARTAAKYTGNPAPRIIVPICLAQLFQPAMAKLAQINHSQPLYTKAMLKAIRSNQHISHARAAHDLGYTPRPFQETIRDTIDWMTEHREILH